MPDPLRYQFEDEMPEDTEVAWLNAGRSQLNQVIRSFNDWQVGGFNLKRAPRVLARIERGIQTFGQQDGGSFWLGVLKRMKAFVERAVEL